MEQLQILLEGRVQGIGFRNKIKKFADNKNLNGFVKNLEDGGIKIIIQGSKPDLNEFILWIKSNPGFSYIKSFHESWGRPSKKYSSFVIIKEYSFLKDKINSIFNLFKISGISAKKPPIHIAIIPDGNRRWARKRGLNFMMGHKKAADYSKFISSISEAKKLGVKYISLWGFSTENWKRDKKEINSIFNIIFQNIKKLRNDAGKNRLRFRYLGRRDRIPKKLLDAIENLERETKNYTDFNLQLCLDYGGRDEIIRAVNRIIKDKKKKIDEKTFSNYLDTADIPDPDLIIRTSKEQRMSGFMPFQSTYSELYFSKKYFPDFDIKELKKAINEFKKRKRRFGGN